MHLQYKNNKDASFFWTDNWSSSKMPNANDCLKTEGAKCSFYSQEQDRIYKFVQTDNMTNEKVNE